MVMGFISQLKNHHNRKLFHYDHCPVTISVIHKAIGLIIKSKFKAQQTSDNNQLGSEPNMAEKTLNSINLSYILNP